MILLFSSLGGYKELVTLVPPPKGINTTLCLCAKATNFSTSYSEATKTTASTDLGNFLCLKV